jgi:hypothetical protein
MRRVLLATIGAIAVVLLTAVAPVAAFQLTTCTLQLTSTDASGGPVDAAASGDQSGSQSAPFKVDWDGQVGYQGSTTDIIKDYAYKVSVFGVPTPLQGKGDNSAENTDGNGSVSVSANSPFRAAGLYYVTGEYTGTGGTCTGSGWFLLRGDPIGTVPWTGGVVLTILGALGLVAGVRGHTLTSLFGGVALGLGLVLLAISHAVLPFAENTPLLILVVSTALGLVIGVLGRRGRGGAPEPPAAA